MKLHAVRDTQFAVTRKVSSPVCIRESQISVLRGRCFIRGYSQPWPPRSPDFTPLLYLKQVLLGLEVDGKNNLKRRTRLWGSRVKTWTGTSRRCWRTNKRTSLTNFPTYTPKTSTVSLPSCVSVKCLASVVLRQQRLMSVYEVISSHLWLFTLKINSFSLNEIRLWSRCVNDKL